MKPHSVPFPKRGKKRSGFALLITITLLAFLVLLLVSLASLTRVEAQVSTNNQYLSQARQNALTSLNIALGQLQKHAGPDLRISARAEIKNATKNGMLTGVWTPSSGVVSPSPDTWLVSGNQAGNTLAVTPDNAPDPSVSAASDEVFLVGSGSVGSDSERVKLKKLPITVSASNVPGLSSSSSDIVVGHYAFWTGDQGIKTSAALVDEVDRLTYNNSIGTSTSTSPAIGDDWTDPLKRATLRQLAAPRPRLEKLFPLPGFDPDTAAIKQALSRVLAPEQIPLTAANMTMADYKRQFHHVAAKSEAVLVDLTTGTGRLRQDMSDTNDLSETNETAIRTYLKARPSQVSGLQATFAVAGQDNPSATTFPMFSIAPVFTEFVARFQFYRSSVNANKLIVRFDLQAELWNPYGASLSAQGSAPDLSVRVSGLPLATVTNDSGIVLGTIDLNAIVGGSLSLTKTDCLWSPGQILVFWGGTELKKGDASHPSILREVEQFIIPPNAKVTIASVPTGQLEVHLLVGSGTTQTTVSRQKPGISFNQTDLTILDDNPAGAVAGFGYDINNSLSPWTNSALPTGSWDIRTPVLSAGFTAGTQTNAWYSNPVLNNHSITLATSSVTFSSISAGGSMRQITLFDLPRQEVISVGQLQHVIGEKPYVLGTETSGGTNGLFDRFFFSTLPRWTTWDPANPPALPNRYIRINTDDTMPLVGDPNGVNGPTSDYLLDRTHAAKYLLQTGAFNINSTSIAAWTAILGGLKNPSWSYHGAGASATAVLNNAFFRLPNGAQEMREPTHANAAIKGVIDLTDAQVSSMATTIVSLIKARGSPFPSLSSFIDSGIVLEAIKSAGINPGSPWDGKLRMPGYLTQGDVFTSLAPFITPRSDTFLIRAYGDVQNPVTETVEGSAWCEAVVQRMPELTEPVSGSVIPAIDPIEPDINKYPFGRRFKIISFRWLSQSEI